MRSIEDLRNEIDDIDDSLSALYTRRMEVCKEIGKLKAKLGSPINVSVREQEIIKRITKGAPDEIKGYLERLYREIFCLSKEYQEKVASAKPTEEDT